MKWFKSSSNIIFKSLIKKIMLSKRKKLEETKIRWVKKIQWMDKFIKIIII